MATLRNSAEGGTNAANVTTGNSGGASGTAFAAVTTSGSSRAIFSTAAAKAGSMGYRFPLDGSSNHLRGEDSAAARGGMGFWLRIEGTPSNHFTLCQIRNGSDGDLGALQVRDNRTIRVLATGGSSIAASQTAALTIGQWYWIEFFLTPDTSTTGRVELRVLAADGTTVVSSYDSGATQNFGTTQPARYRFGGATNGSGWTNVDMDDLAWGAQASAWHGPPTPPSSDDPPILDIEHGVFYVVDLRGSTTDPPGGDLLYDLTTDGLDVTEPVPGLFLIEQDATTHDLTATVTDDDTDEETSDTVAVPAAGAVVDSLTEEIWDGDNWVS